MKLTKEQIKEKIDKPANRRLIEEAAEQEDRLTLHTETVFKPAVLGRALTDFKTWVASLLPADKYKRFEQLLTFPVETVDDTQKVFSELSKFFNAPDQSIKSAFVVPDLEIDFSEYMAALGNDDFWETKGFKALQSGINSFIVIDLPAEQLTEQPAPYFYILPVKSVHDVMINEDNGRVEYIIFKDKTGDLIAAEDSAWRRYRKSDGGEWVFIAESLHDLQYTPVCSFFRRDIKGTSGINKKSPLTSSLSKLDWLLFFRTSKKYLDTYGAWPIVVTYTKDCNYKDEKGNMCEEGYINYEYPDTTSGGLIATQKRCPACEKRGVIGAGSFWEVDPPRDKDDVDLMINPVKIIEISNDKLQYCVDETERLRREIYLNATGHIPEATKEAINEKQVVSQYESRKSILDGIREQFELSNFFVLDTIARLRYGNYYIGTNVHYGKEYFLQTPEDIADQYAGAKKAGLPAYEVARIRETYSQTRFKNNEQQYRRALILSQLEPYPDYTAGELKTFGIDVADPILFELKLNFPNYIAEFERENMDIVEFGSAINFGLKISIITQKLNDYVTKRTKGRPQPNGEAIK